MLLRSIVARIIDPEAFEPGDYDYAEYVLPTLQKRAFAKADEVLTALGRAGVDVTLRNGSRVLSQGNSPLQQFSRRR